MKKITFVIPSRNNLEFLQLAYKSIRNLETKHEILVLNDASTDGTQEWINSLKDEDLITHHNPGPERIGIVGMFDKGIEMARTEIIFAIHSDMIAAPDLDKNILKHLKKGTVVTATRVDVWCETQLSNLKITEGIFAPWCMYKEDFLAVGGHDELFAPQSKEDSDLFNRFSLKGYKFIQPWNALVYHFTSRGSRFNKHAGGAAGKDSPEWQYTTNKNGKNFVRKWGHYIKHDDYMKPIIFPKYDIGIILTNSTIHLLELLEPWCSTIYIDPSIITDYIKIEQPNTIINLHDRVKPSDNEKQNGILVEIDGKKFTQQDMNYIQQLPEILNDSTFLEEDMGCQFEIGNLFLTIINVKTESII